MAVPEYLARRFGGQDKVPAYIRKYFERRAARTEQKRQEEREAKERLARERARIKALRRPPARVWRIGQTLFWDPPETVDQLKPAGYWVSEERNGSWTAHGDYVLPDVFESQLFGTGDARVECYYSDTALGESYPSPAVACVETGKDRFLVGTVRYNAEHTAQAHLWRRVLSAFGAGRGRWHDLRRGAMANDPEPMGPPMTAAEADKLADLYGPDWRSVARVLRRLNPDEQPEAKPETPDKPEEPAENAELIATLRQYLKEPASKRPPVYYERWTRALAGLGAAQHDDPMAAAEARGYADRGWRRWIPVADALERIESIRDR